MNLFSSHSTYAQRGIIGEKNKETDNIDTSSYDNTMTINTYNSMKTLKSKITD